MCFLQDNFSGSAFNVPLTVFIFLLLLPTRAYWLRIVVDISILKRRKDPLRCYGGFRTS